MSLKRRLKRLEAKTDLESFELEDGTRFYYDRMEPGINLFLHCMHCLRAHDQDRWPDPPPIIHALIRAKDREAACAEFFREGFQLFAYELEPLIERGELVRRSMVAGRAPGEPIPCLSEDGGT